MGPRFSCRTVADLERESVVGGSGLLARFLVITGCPRYCGRPSRYARDAAALSGGALKKTGNSGWTVQDLLETERKRTEILNVADSKETSARLSLGEMRRNGTDDMANKE